MIRASKPIPAATVKARSWVAPSGRAPARPAQVEPARAAADRPRPATATCRGCAACRPARCPCRPGRWPAGRPRPATAAAASRTVPSPPAATTSGRPVDVAAGPRARPRGSPAPSPAPSRSAPAAALQVVAEPLARGGVVQARRPRIDDDERRPGRRQGRSRPMLRVVGAAVVARHVPGIRATLPLAQDPQVEHKGPRQTEEPRSHGVLHVVPAASPMFASVPSLPVGPQPTGPRHPTVSLFRAPVAHHPPPSRPHRDALAGRSYIAHADHGRTSVHPDGPRRGRPPHPGARRAPAPSSAAEPKTEAQQIIRIAKAQRGDPWRYGATGPESFDCSGLVIYAYKQAGDAKAHRQAASSARRRLDVPLLQGAGPGQPLQPQDR